MEECLKKFLEPTQLKGNESYECTICKEKTEAVTNLEISETKDILIVNLKR